VNRTWASRREDGLLLATVPDRAIEKLFLSEKWVLNPVLLGRLDIS
jgi:hypothetical protein